MAFGIGKAFKKGWKKTFGKLEDEIKPYTPIIAGVTLGALTGGFGAAALGSVLSGTAAAGTAAAGAAAAGTGAAFSGTGALIGGGIGAMQGYSSYVQGKQQEDMIAAQLAAADKIAAAQQTAPTIQSAAIPAVSTQKAATAEMNEATSKRKAFSFANTRRTGSVARRNTLG